MDVLNLPPVRTPPRVGPSTRRWQRELQQWQREYEKARPSRERRRLPIELDDEVPKAWMTRELVHDEERERQEKMAELRPVPTTSLAEVTLSGKLLESSPEQATMSKEKVAQLRNVAANSLAEAALSGKLQESSPEQASTSKEKIAQLRHIAATRLTEATLSGQLQESSPEQASETKEKVAQLRHVAATRLAEAAFSGNWLESPPKQARETPRNRAIAMEAFHEAERARFAARIADIPAKILQVQEDAAEVSKLQLQRLQELDSQNKAKKPTVEALSRQCEAVEIEAASLDDQKHDLEVKIAAETSELGTLRDLVKQKEFECEEAESLARAAQAMAYVQHQINRWSRFCKLLQERGRFKVISAILPLNDFTVERVGPPAETMRTEEMWF